MEHFQFRTPMSRVWPDTSRIKTHIIAGEHIPKSTRCLLSDMAWNGAQMETIKMVSITLSDAVPPSLKAGENERRSAFDELRFCADELRFSALDELRFLTCL